MNIGFIGLGLMGKPMAHHIDKAGFPIVVYNRTKEKIKKGDFAQNQISHSLSDIGRYADCVITMVTKGSDVEEVIFGKDGVVRHAKKGTVFVDMSTIGPTAAKKIGTKLERIGMHFLDAPVTGGTYGAESGKLTIFVGGNEQIFQKLRPVFSSMGDNIHYMGETGSGQAIKMINN